MGQIRILAVCRGACYLCLPVVVALPVLVLLDHHNLLQLLVDLHEARLISAINILMEREIETAKLYWGRIESRNTKNDSSILCPLPN